MKKLIVCAALIAAFACSMTAMAAPKKDAQKTEQSAPSLLGVNGAPSGIIVTNDGVLVTDTYNKVIWKVNMEGTKKYAGEIARRDMYGEPQGGYQDKGMGQSLFREPWAIARYRGGFAVTDSKNNVVRLISSEGVETIAGVPDAGNSDGKGIYASFNLPTGLTSDKDGNLYVSDSGNGAIRKIDVDGRVTTVVKGLDSPSGLCWKDGVLYVCETGLNRIVTVTQDTITPFAGSGIEGLTDGGWFDAQFSAPQGIAVDEDNTIYVADTGNHAIRKLAAGMTETILVSNPKELYSSPVSPRGIVVTPEGLLVCDNFLRTLMLVSK